MGIPFEAKFFVHERNKGNRSSINLKETTKDWIELANRDFYAAKTLAAYEYLANVCLFHCQQSIEKLFKAILEGHSLKIPRIHSVTTPFENLPPEFKDISNIEQGELELIDNIYIDSRYPGEIGLLPNGLPSKSDAESILRIAEKIFQSVLKYIEAKI